MHSLHWKKSSYSGDGSNCVEIAIAPATVHVRDSKSAEGPRLAVAPAAWAEFISYAVSPSGGFPRAGGR